LNSFQVYGEYIQTGMKSYRQIARHWMDRSSGIDGQVKEYTVTPEEFGLVRADLQDLQGGRSPAEAAAQVREILAGTPGPKLDMVLLNSGAALYAAGNAKDIRTGIEQARQVIQTGGALARLDALVAHGREAG